MSDANCRKLSLNVFINKQKSKVLFAEANSDVVDVLLSFLTMPMGKIVKILKNHYGSEAPAIGSLTTLYGGLLNLDANHFSVAGAKKMLLDPPSSSEKSKLDFSDDNHARYFVCQDSHCCHSKVSNVSLFPDIASCDCGKPLNREIVVAERLAHRVLMRSTSTFIVFDDLRFVPSVGGLSQTLENLGVADSGEVEMRSMSLGIRNIMDFLKCVLISTAPLTDLFINSGKISSSAGVSEPETLLHRIEKEAVSDASKETTIILKVSLQKSTNKLLFAQAKGDFLDLLFSFLTMPLGMVECMLGGNTCLKNIDNLYRSLDGIDHEYFSEGETKTSLLNPKLSHGYIFQSQFLPLNEEDARELYYRDGGFSNEGGGSLVSSFKSRVGEGKCVKELTEYIVSDDLTVKPYSIASTVSILNGFGVPLSDVEETELAVGMEEALCIVKASLTSTTALTDALIYTMLKKIEHDALVAAAAAAEAEANNNVYHVDDDDDDYYD